MWELDHKEGWALKNWCFWTAVLEKTLESPLDYKETQPVHPKDQSWIFIRRTDAEAETPILWQHDVKNWLIWKDPDAGKDWGQEEKGWQRMRWLNGITTQWALVWINSGSWWWTGRPGVLWSVGLQEVGQTEKLKETGAPVVKNLPIDAEDARSDPWVGKSLWRRKCQPILVFLPGKSHGQKNLGSQRSWTWLSE